MAKYTGLFPPRENKKIFAKVLAFVKSACNLCFIVDDM